MPWCTIAGIILLALGVLSAGVLWGCIRISHPETPEEERAQLEQDLKDLHETMNDRIARKEARHAGL